MKVSQILYGQLLIIHTLSKCLPNTKDRVDQSNYGWNKFTNV